MPSATYKHLKKFDPATNEGKRLPFQLQTIMDHIEKAGKDGITQEELVKQLAEGNKLNTRQPIERVINFYHQRIKDLGLAEVNKIVVPKTPATKVAQTGKTTVVVGEGPQDGAAKPPSAPPPGAAQPVGKSPV